MGESLREFRADIIEQIAKQLFPTRESILLDCQIDLIDFRL